MATTSPDVHVLRPEKPSATLVPDEQPDSLAQARAASPSPEPAPTATEAPAPDQAVELKLRFPPFNVFAARQAGPKVRTPNDKRFDFAELRDIEALWRWTQQAAGGAAIQVAQFTSELQAQQFNAKIDHEMKSLARAFDRALAEALERRINEYDAWRRERAWYRRLWRWVRRGP